MQGLGVHCLKIKIKKLHIKSMYLFQYFAGLESTFGKKLFEIIMAKEMGLYRAPGLHKLWYPGIRDTSTWSKFGAHGEHGDVFLFSNLGAL